MGNIEKYLLTKCCGCGSLRTGSLIAGVAGIILATIGILVELLTDIEMKSIVLDWLPKSVLLIIAIINFCMTIILSILLIVGIIKRNFFLMIPWVILGGMLAIGILVSILMTSISLYIDGDNLNGSLWLVLGLISWVIYCYMWYVTFSFFYQIWKESGRGQYIKDPFRRHY